MSLVTQYILELVMIADMEHLARYGAPEAQLILGVLHENGFGVKIDPNMALKYYLEAMTGGSLLAQRYAANLIIKLHPFDERTEEGVSLLRDAAQKGDVGSQLDLVYYFQLGKLAPQTDSELLDWAQKAAHSGYAPAAGYLGYMYEFGRGVTKDEHLAFKWYLRAAELGEADAAASVGRMYEKGVGVEKNEQKALEWIEIGAKRNSSVAHRMLSGIYMFGNLGKSQDLDKAKEHAQLAAKLWAEQTSHNRKKDAVLSEQPPLLP